MRLTAVLIAFSVAVLNCKYYSVKDVSFQNDLQNKNLKIGLIGFNPFTFKESSKSQKIDRSSALVTTTTTAFINYEKTMKSSLGIGESVSKYVQPGYKTDVSADKIKNFVKIYLDHAKASGIQEILQIVEIPDSEKDKNTPLRLKNHSADYLVIAVHEPVFSEKATDISRNLFLSVAGLLTLGIIPIDYYEKASSTFYIFDKKLNLLDKKSIGESVRIFSGWFVPSNADMESNKNPPPIAFKPHIQEYHNYLAEFLNKK